ncbi:hypothetical protein Raf01_68160 [Rugosimonospora africana]|uniref:Uncharacterized protein n=1 Tax=Rugosimonospora africana TaxID=556532 RepID=A0A8J3QYM1_9ACTN|nr:hypothetical protein Raf01_68160 [Rugosimonospora africana]
MPSYNRVGHGLRFHPRPRVRACHPRGSDCRTRTVIGTTIGVRSRQPLRYFRHRHATGAEPTAGRATPPALPLSTVDDHGIETAEHQNGPERRDSRSSGTAGAPEPQERRNPAPASRLTVDDRCRPVTGEAASRPVRRRTVTLHTVSGQSRRIAIRLDAPADLCGPRDFFVGNLQLIDSVLCHWRGWCTHR